MAEESPVAMSVPDLAAARDEAGKGINDDVGALLVVQAPDEAQQHSVWILRQAQLPLQLCFAPGLACAQRMGTSQSAA